MAERKIESIASVMAMLLKKVWESMSNRSSSCSDSSGRNLDCESTSSSLGQFDQIPEDVLLQIVRSLGPKEAAKASTISKAWKSLVSNDRLWIYFLQNQQGHSCGSILFAETNLQFGYLLHNGVSMIAGESHQRQLSDQLPQLPFMHIYSQRMQVPGSVIIDGKYFKISQVCIFSPLFCTVVKHALKMHHLGGISVSGDMMLPLKNICIGLSEHSNFTNHLSLLGHHYWSYYSHMIHVLIFFIHILYKVALVIASLVGVNLLVHLGGRLLLWMQVKTHTQPVVLSLPLCHYDDTESARASRWQLKEAIYKTLFDMNVPAVCAISQATLALYTARRTSGIVVNIGFQVTSVVPILNGKIMRKVGVEVVGLGALKLTGFLRELMQQNNIVFESLYSVRTLKEELCYVAADYEAELCKDTLASFTVAREGSFTLSKERFQTGEILFQPRIAGVLAMGLHQAVALCMDHCRDAELMGDDAWFKTVVLTGGTACLPGLAGRLEKELHKLLSPSLSNGITVIPPPYGVDTPWFGAKLISNLSTFPGPWCMTRKQFQRKSKLNLSW